MRKEVYNLEFRSYCQEMTINGYRFARVKGYRDRVASLQHLVGLISEFEICPNVGINAVTAIVECPDNETESVLNPPGTDKTALSDILLLLSLFTGRDVFAVNKKNNSVTRRLMTADSRVYSWGGELRIAIPYKECPLPGNEPFGYDTGLEEGLNIVYALIRQQQWQHQYEGGYFLTLANQAFRCQALETAFTQCWTIWEHLFAVHNNRWLSDDEIRRLNPTEKLAFLLVEYALKGEIDRSEKGKIKSLVEARNRLVHFGRFPERGAIFQDAVLFVRLTELIITKALGLTPTSGFNTMEELENYLKPKSEGNSAEIRK
jgi:hypothetical protein